MEHHHHCSCEHSCGCEHHHTNPLPRMIAGTVLYLAALGLSLRLETVGFILLLVSYLVLSCDVLLQAAILRKAKLHRLFWL